MPDSQPRNAKGWFLPKPGAQRWWYAQSPLDLTKPKGGRPLPKGGKWNLACPVCSRPFAGTGWMKKHMQAQHGHLMTRILLSVGSAKASASLDGDTA